MEILVTKEPIDSTMLQSLAEAWHGDLVKGVVDVKQGVIALGGDWHMDGNVKLMENGSSQEDVWGFNVYPGKSGDAALEYISLINIRPRQGNRDMEVGDEGLRKEMRAVIARLVPSLGL